MFGAYFEDKEHGGLVHAMSEDWSAVRDADKHADEQFNDARTQVIGAMITHDPDAIVEAQAAVEKVMARFEDPQSGGFFFMAERDWKISKKEKSLGLTGEIFSVLMHLYEVSKRDAYLLKALEFLDVALDNAWDQRQGGFFSLYHQDWRPAIDVKDLATQATMLQHMNGSWKDGMDSPYGARAAAHRLRAEQFGDLLLAKASDPWHGGFYTAFTADWRPAETDKSVDQLASLALTLYFHYHNMGPSIWGPRKGSHAYTGRPYPDVYTYLGPAPSLDPVSERAYRFGQAVVDIAELLLEHAWDPQHGGFFTSLREGLAPAKDTKQIQTQITCLLALNVAYRLTGFKRFQQKLAEAVATIEERCFDPDNGGAYLAFERDWQPAVRDKICGPNLMAGGILSMVAPVAKDMEVTRQTLGLWIEPAIQEVAANGAALFTVTVQNQGFQRAGIRVGGLSTPSRWMHPGDMRFDLGPHQIATYRLCITPPPGMPAGVYPFELTCLYEGGVSQYVAAAGRVKITSP
jgi:mannose/cellobiose epimerase-like protein (N-acyl-D-glucosamine 2-epimerase family)